MDTASFSKDIQDFISKSIDHDSLKKNVLSCRNCFKNNDNYQDEKIILDKIKRGDFKSTKEQGDLLEELLKKLFSRITLLNSLSVTNKDTALGQIDISLITIDDDETIFEIWGMIGDVPSCLIGECKNYKSDKVARPEIEKTCWRASKGSALSFFIGPAYTQAALDEISYFNLNKQHILNNGQGVYVIPITIDMIEIILLNNLNFCYFIRWAIKSSKRMIISNYL